MDLAKTKAVLCVIGGVLYVGDHPISGAPETVNRIKTHYPVRFLTNTTQKTGNQVVAKLHKMGFDIDASKVITALESASGKTAKIIGKPSKGFYHLACASMDAEPSECVMIGDDIESDIAGAQAAGLQAILVRTGKFNPEHLRMGIEPDAVLDSIADLSL